jgi:casein kinase II subunit beta
MSIRSRSSRPARVDLRQDIDIPPPPDIPRDWKRRFLREERHSWLCEIPDSYISDNFNVFGLDEIISDFSACRDVIVGNFSPGNLPPAILKRIKDSLLTTYGLIHARFIMSPDGLKCVRDKYLVAQYGTCPRLSCHSEPVLPFGVTGDLGKETVKVFCPCCREIYAPKGRQNLDGAFFGPNMAHIFLDEMNLTGKRREFEPYVHMAFGFRVKT